MATGPSNQVPGFRIVRKSLPFWRGITPFFVLDPATEYGVFEYLETKSWHR